MLVENSDKFLLVLSISFESLALILQFLLFSELSEGIPVLTDEGEEVGRSVAAAKKGITEVVVSRIVMAVPGMGGSYFDTTQKI